MRSIDTRYQNLILILVNNFMYNVKLTDLIVK